MKTNLTTDKHRWTRMSFISLSVLIRVHPWFKKGLYANSK
jgi:hypothetical protein